MIAMETESELAERYHRLVEATPDGIVVHRGGLILHANPAAARIFGASDPGDLVGRGVLSLVHPDHHETVRERVRRIEEEGARTPPLDIRGVRLDGAVIDIEVSGHPVLYGGTAADQSVIRDITQRKRAEAEAQAQLVARPLVREMITTLLRHVAVPQEATRDVGRRLAAAGFSSTEDAMRAFRAMGLGSVALVKSGETLVEFEGHDLIEHRAGSSQPTCYLSLAFLEGALASVLKKPVRGTETRCQSLGHGSCRFVLKPKG